MSRGTYRPLDGKVASMSRTGAIVFIRDHKGGTFAIPREAILGHETLKVGDAALYVSNDWLARYAGVPGVKR